MAYRSKGTKAGAWETIVPRQSPHGHGDGQDEWLVVAFEIEDLVHPMMVLDLVWLDVLRVWHPAVKDHQSAFWRGRGFLVCSGSGKEVNWPMEAD